MSCLPDDRSAPASKVNRAFSARHLATAESWDAVPGFNMNAAPVALKTCQTRCLCHAFVNANNARSNRLRVPGIVDLRHRRHLIFRSRHQAYQECDDVRSALARRSPNGWYEM